MEITKDKITEICKRLRDASIYTSKKYRSSSILERYFFFHLSGSKSRYMLSGVFGGSAAALLMTSDIYSKKLTPCSPGACKRIEHGCPSGTSVRPEEKRVSPG